MSILDGMPDERWLAVVKKTSAAAVAELTDSDAVSPKVKSIVALMNEGLSFGDIVGIEKKHRDALLFQASTFIQAGDPQSAEDILRQLRVLEPTDERAAYMLGVIAQQRGDLKEAASHYVQFLAFDANNPDGYLRLGECLMAAGELDKAGDIFAMALGLAQAARLVDRVQHAERMIAAVAARRSAA